MMRVSYEYEFLRDVYGDEKFLVKIGCDILLKIRVCF